MGFHSKTCAKTHLPVLVPARNIPKLNHIVALLPTGEIYHGTYDGYGRIETADGVIDLNAKWSKVKLVLRVYYEGEQYDDLGPSKSELSQGYFADNKFIHFCLLQGPFKNHGAYVRAFKKHANWL
jgi:hypothetical protein